MPTQGQTRYKALFATGFGIFLSFVPAGVAIIATHGNYTLAWALIGIGILSALIAIYSGIKLWNTEEQSHVEAIDARQSNEGEKQLRTTIESLMRDITQFAANRELSHPSPTEKWGSPDEWFQKSSAYSKQSEYLYKIQYQQRLVTLGTELHQSGYLTDEELRDYSWHIETGYLRPSELLLILARCDSKLKTQKIS